MRMVRRTDAKRSLHCGVIRPRLARDEMGNVVLAKGAVGVGEDGTGRRRRGCSTSAFSSALDQRGDVLRSAGQNVRFSGGAEPVPNAGTQFTTTREAAPKPIVPAKQAKVPFKDAWETDYLVGTPGAIPARVRAWIRYRDKDGQDSEREILTELLVPYIDSGHALLAFCHDLPPKKWTGLSRFSFDIERAEIAQGRMQAT